MITMLRMALLGALLGIACVASAATLRINISAKGALHRAVWQSTLDDFGRANPDIEIKASFVDPEIYKVQLPGWLASQAPDVITWHTGQRMAFYASRGLLDDLSGDWSRNGWDVTYAAGRHAASYQGRQYALPTVHYAWGMFYRKDLLATAGIDAEPLTWEQLLMACAKLKAAGITPFAVGGRDAWTLAGWFDYLNLRLNGLAFHQQLMTGKIAYTDARVRKVYRVWGTLIDQGYFIDNALSYDLDGVQPFLFQGKAAMMLMGSFIASSFPSAMAPRMGYFRFPVIDAGIPMAEDVPTESIHIPSRARNKADARRLLAFVGTPAISARLAQGQSALPANAAAPVPDDALARSGLQILAGADGAVAQFYDRDMTKEMADEGMKGMQKFVSDPSRIDQVLEQLERSRRRIYGKS